MSRQAGELMVSGLRHGVGEAGEAAGSPGAAWGAAGGPCIARRVRKPGRPVDLRARVGAAALGSALRRSPRSARGTIAGAQPEGKALRAAGQRGKPRPRQHGPPQSRGAGSALRVLPPPLPPHNAPLRKKLNGRGRPPGNPTRWKRGCQGNAPRAAPDVTAGRAPCPPPPAPRPRPRPPVGRSDW